MLMFSNNRFYRETNKVKISVGSDAMEQIFLERVLKLLLSFIDDIQTSVDATSSDA